MIERVVLIKLKPEYIGELQTIARQTTEVLGTAPEIGNLRVATAADPRTERRWDLSILAEFADLDAVARYREHRVHRAYVDVYLRPMLAKIRAWNFSR
jgi:hypothetical protein